MYAPVQVYSYCNYIHIVRYSKSARTERKALLICIKARELARRNPHVALRPAEGRSGNSCRAATTTQSLQLQSGWGFVSVAPLRKGPPGNRQAQVAFILLVFEVVGISPINHP
jgi:hypothetical protein